MPRQVYDHERVIRDMQDHLADGGTLKDFCARKKNPSRVHLWHLIRDNPEFEAKYKQVLEYQAVWIADEIKNATREVRDGVLDAKRGRVVIASLQWQAEKFWKRLFGKDETVADVARDLKDVLNEARKRAGAGRLENTEPKPMTIEGEVQEVPVER